ncbi:MAG TPA: glycosyltransferase [Solirubrobacteraceae bacterium]|jgi:glycosyltransferase involved in cell wall biosynthesis|nr:glycosyltransferase [Solirubrobacteraceae bacterium]
MAVAPPPRRLRVMTLIDHADVVGGAELLAVQVAAGLDPTRFESHLCASRSPDEGVDPAVDQAIALLREANVSYHTLGRRRKIDVWRWGLFVNLLRREAIDILHAHKFGSNAWAVLTGRLARVPVIVAHEHTRNDPYSSNRLRTLIDRRLIARHSDMFVAVSRADRRYMVEAEGIPLASTVFVPNGAPESRHTPGVDARTQLGVASGIPTVGSAGFMHRRKRFDLLVRAAGELRSEFPDLRVFIAGDGDERVELERLVSSMGLGETVVLLGRRTDVVDLLPGLDVAVCCSDHEGSPISVMEYMDAARPIVATRVGGNPDLIEDGEDGLLVEPGDHRALALAIGRLLRDRELGERLGAAARIRRRHEFTMEAMCQRLEALYSELWRSQAVPDRVPAGST